MRSRRIAVTIAVGAIAVAACSSGDGNSTAGDKASTTTSSDAGAGNTGKISAAVIAQCNESGGAAATALEAYLTGSQTADQTVQSLDSAQRGLSAAASTATAQDPQIGTKIQAFSDVVGQAKDGIADGSLGPEPATKLVVDALGVEITRNIVEMVKAKRVRAVVGSIVEFGDVPEAIEAMANRETVGRTIVKLWEG